jgi:predicted RND superfamily exporter protein
VSFIRLRAVVLNALGRLETIPNFAWRYPRFVLIAAAVVLLFALAMAPSLRMQFDLYESHDDSFGAVQNYQVMKQSFSDSNRSDLRFHLTEPATAGRLCEAFGVLRRLRDETKSPFVTQTLWDVRKVLNTPDRLSYPKILDDPCTLAPNEVPALERGLFTHGPGEFLFPASENEFRISITFTDQEAGLPAIAKELEKIQSELSSGLQAERSDVLGVVGFRYAFYQAFKRDAVAAGLSVIAISLLLAFLIGSVKGVLVYLGISGFAIVTLIGLMAALGAQADFLINSLILMLLIACLSDYLFIAFRSQRGLQEAFKVMAVPSSLTSLTTIIGFITLRSSDLASIRSFGTWASVGVFLEWLVTFTILPAFCSWLKWDFSLVNESRSWKPKIFNVLRRAQPSPALMAAVLVVTILGVPSFFFLNFRDEPLKNFPAGHPFRSALEKQSREEGWQGVAFVMVPPTVGKDQERDLLVRIRQWPGTARLVTGDEILVGMTPGLDEIRRDLVLREAESAGVLRAWRTPDGFKRHLLLLKSYDSDTVLEIEKTIESVCKYCFMAGQSLVYAEYNRRLGMTLTSGFVESLVTVLLLLLFLTWLKEPGLYGPILISILVGPLAMVTLIALLGIPVNLVTCIFFAVIVGLTGDNAIQFLFSEGSHFQEKMHDRSEASLVMTLMLIAFSSMFLFQTLVPVKWLGVLFLLGFAINFFGDLNVLQGLIERRERKKSASSVPLA